MINQIGKNHQLQPSIYVLRCHLIKRLQRQPHHSIKLLQANSKMLIILIQRDKLRPQLLLLNLKRCMEILRILLKAAAAITNQINLQVLLKEFLILLELAIILITSLNLKLIEKLKLKDLQVLEISSLAS